MSNLFVPVNTPCKLITLQQMIRAASHEGKAIVPISGVCMEGVDIMDGGKVAVDFTHYPRPYREENGKYIDGDPCICYASPPAREDDEPERPPIIMCKQYIGVWIGHMVGTRYKWSGSKGRMNCGFTAIAILGVVFASWGPDGKLLWETDPEMYPTELPSKITVKGGNIDEEATFVRRNLAT